jgi:acyl-CoA reductase-like NAD-dependent aldehyde dehydrogenase
MGTQQTISPVDGRVYVERVLASRAAIASAVERARKAQRGWKHVALAERARLCARMVEAFVACRDEIADEITWQMGRPRAQSPREVAGFAERARAMISCAEEALGEIRPPPKAGFTRFIRREPLGLVLAIAPWNYPYLSAVNWVVPAVLAGNAVLLKHSPQTPLCAERIAEAFEAAGLPAGVFQFLHMSQRDTTELVSSSGIDFVAFTGSMRGGLAIQEAASRRLIGVGLELGGKDPAYVRKDAALEPSVEGLTEGVLFNAGQSCCAVERIYVHADLYDPFAEAFVARTRRYRLGHPFRAGVDLGPLVSASAAAFVREQVDEARAAGARALIDPKEFPADEPGSPYVAPQVLVNVNHAMRVMREESFGPVVGIMKVRNDEEAVALMNDSEFGLTASVWTRDQRAARALGERVETGTWFMNRCDVADPDLAWTGVKNSGRGCSLSRVGYEVLTRPKSFHLRGEA